MFIVAQIPLKIHTQQHVTRRAEEVATAEGGEGVNEEEGIDGGDEGGDDEEEHEFWTVRGEPTSDPFETGFIGDDVDDFGAVEGVNGNEVEDHENHVDVDGKDEEGAEKCRHVEPTGE